MRAFSQALFLSACWLLSHGAALAAITTEGQVQLPPGIGTVVVGTSQGDGVLRVTPPSTLTAGSLQITQGSSSSFVSGSVFVEGGSIVVQSSTTVGSAGRGLLAVSDGGTLDTQSLTVGALSRSPAASEGKVEIRDPGSRIRVNNQFTIGDFSFGELVIENGGRLQPLSTQSSQAPAYIGRSSGGVGTVRVDGAGSVWQNNGPIFVGESGHGSLSITGGASVTSGGGSIGTGLQSPTPGLGTAIISGPGSRWTTSSLTIGGGGTGEMRVENGGLLDVGGIESSVLGALTLGLNPNSFGRLIVTGAGSQWTGNMTVGDRGAGELILENSVIATGGAMLGRQTGGNGLAIVRGQGTRWNPATLIIGATSTSNPGQGELRIEDGAVVSLPTSPTLAMINPMGRVVLDGGTLRRAGIDQGQFDSRGVLEGSGEVIIQNFRNTGGRVAVGPGEKLKFSGALTNTVGQSTQLPAQIEVFGGELEVGGNFNNQKLSRVIAENATLRTRGPEGFANQGHVAITGGVNRVFGRLSNSVDSTLAITGNSQVTFYDAVRNTGVMSASAGSHVTILGAFSGAGIAGAGAVDLEGAVQPGTSPGVMTFGGDVNLGGASRLEIEVGGTTPGTGFDQVRVNGTIELGGTLRLTALAAIDGDAMLPIVEAGELLGAFSSLPAIGANLGFGVRFNGITYDYNHDEAVVSLVQSQAGDFNLDGAVNGGDLLVWQRALGTVAEHPGVGADGNCDGLVDWADLTMWSADIAAAKAAAAGQNAVQSAVPEPPAMGLLLVAVIGGLGVRGRRGAACRAL